MKHTTPRQHSRSHSPLRRARMVYLYRTLIGEGEVNVMGWVDDKRIPSGWTTQQFNQAAEDLLLESCASIDPWMTLHPVFPAPTGTEG